MNRRRAIGRAIACLLCSAVLCIGCRSKVKDYMPTPDAARNAVETALTAWQAGQRPSLIESSQAQVPAVQTIDSEWTAGERRLAEFKDIESVPNEEGPPKFKVRLRYDRIAETQEAVYYVVGKNPLLVYRDKDFESLAKGM